jgi:hypothetical protein
MNQKGLCIQTLLTGVHVQKHKKLQGHLDYLAKSIAFQLCIMQGNRGDRPEWLKNMIAHL